MAVARALARACALSRNTFPSSVQAARDFARCGLDRSNVGGPIAHSSLLPAHELHSSAHASSARIAASARSQYAEQCAAALHEYDGIRAGCSPSGHACSSRPARGPSTFHKERRLMPFSPSELFSVVADVDSYQEFVPWCRESCVTRRLEAGKYEADLVVGFKMFQEKYTSVVTASEPSLVLSEAADSKLFNHLVTRWEIKPGPSKTTSWVTFSIDFSFKNMLYAQTASLFFDQVVAKMIGAFDTRCRQIYRTTGAKAGAPRPAKARVSA